MAAKKIKEDPPELESKVDMDESTTTVDVVETDMFKEAPEVKEDTVSAKDFAALMEQNRVLMAKLEEMTAGPEVKKEENSGVPVLDGDKPIIYQRKEGSAWLEQDGNRFSQKFKYLGPVVKN